MSTIMASAPPYKGEIHMAYTPQSLEDPFAELKAAVVSLSVEDYLNLICGFMEDTPLVNIEELERFFTGEDFSLYSDLDGSILMQKNQRLRQKDGRQIQCPEDQKAPLWLL